MVRYPKRCDGILTKTFRKGEPQVKLSNIVIACAFAGAITQAPTVLAATDAQEKLEECSGAILTVDEPVWLSEQDNATKKRYRTKLLACTNGLKA